MLGLQSLHAINRANAQAAVIMSANDPGHNRMRAETARIEASLTTPGEKGLTFDTIPGHGVQPWSRGDIFPLTIARRERYSQINLYNNGAVHDTRPALDCAYFDVLNADDDMKGFATYDDAYTAAQGWLLQRYADELEAAQPI